MGLSSSKSGGDDFEDSVDRTLEKRLLFHALARSLEGGCPLLSRPALPIELVSYILRLAGCVLPSPSLSVSSTADCRAEARSGTVVLKSWFRTPPLDRHALSRAAKFQLVTISKDQGWCSNHRAGSWSWFEVAILSTSGQELEVISVKKRDVGGEELVWESHRNPVASRTYAEREGVVFETDHEIWQYLDEGDVIEVRVCAQFSGWCNKAQEGTLRVLEWFEPTLPPRTAW